MKLGFGRYVGVNEIASVTDAGRVYGVSFHGTAALDQAEHRSLRVKTLVKLVLAADVGFISLDNSG